VNQFLETDAQGMRLSPAQARLRLPLFILSLKDLTAWITVIAPIRQAATPPVTPAGAGGQSDFRGFAVYKCRECISGLCRQLVATLEPSCLFLPEIVLVSDACPANSWDAIVAVASRDMQVKRSTFP
jgi:hypothetical protein